MKTVCTLTAALLALLAACAAAPGQDRGPTTQAAEPSSRAQRTLGAARQFLLREFETLLAEPKRYSLQAERRPDKPDDLMVVLDAKTGGRYADAAESPILITGDSALMYNMGSRAGHMPAHIGALINMPISFASNTIPPEHFGKVSGRRVVIWANMARMLVGCKWPTRTPAK